MRILITGGAGFIGSHTAEALVARGHAVRVFDNLTTGALDNLANLGNRAQFVLGDVLDPAALQAAMRGCDAVIHLAAVVSVPLSITEPAGAHAVNATGTLHVLEAARALGIRRVVLASSAAVYGAQAHTPIGEDAPLASSSPYALQKEMGERYAALYRSLHGLAPISLRYFNVYGPRQNPGSPYSGVLSRFIDAALAGRPASIHGDGSQARDFVYVKDVADANARAALVPQPPEFDRLNVGTGIGTRVIEAYFRIAALAGLGEEAAPRFEPPRAGDIRQSVADVARAEATLGFVAGTPLEVGLAETLAWARTARRDGVSVVLG